MDLSNKNNIILSTTNADCILLLFFDPVKKVIANVHSFRAEGENYGLSTAIISLI